MKNKEKYTSKDCTFLLLAKLPNGKIHQVLIEQEYLKWAISQTNEFKVLEIPLEGLDFETKE